MSLSHFRMFSIAVGVLVFVSQPVTAISKSVTIWDDFIEDTTLRKGYTYLVAGVVHVPAGIKLTIEDGVTLYLKNGKIRPRVVDRAALIFDPGSLLEAESFTVKAAGADGRPEKKSDNGGIWFLGSVRDASKDGVTVKSSSEPSSFSAEEIRVSHLGKLDPTPSPQSLNPRGDDLDAISVLGIGPKEWKIKKIQSDFSGDDGVDLTNSSIELEEIQIFSPFEDGLNVSSSRLRVSKKLAVNMTKNLTVKDRDLFDLEVDDGPSYVTLAKGCKAELQGVFGDELKLRSSDLPKPSDETNSLYRFQGFLKRGPATIWSRTED